MLHFDSLATNSSPASSVGILLVDENVDIQDYVRRLLSRDYEVKVVSDRSAVWDAIQRSLPDLVLIDVMMLESEGVELLRSLRNDPATQNIPIILLSARGAEESGVEELDVGADDYLFKPFCARELLARIRTNLELARLRREAVRYQERLQVEAQVAQSQVSNILESITDAFVAFDREWHYTYVNEYATRLLRKKREELLGKHVWKEVFPEAVGTESYWEYHRAVAEQVPIVFETFSQPMGMWIEVNAYPSPEGLALYFRDITHRKRAEQALRDSEERFRQLTENIDTVFFMSEGFSETSPGRIAYVSPAYERIWGRSCESLYQNTRSWFEAIHPGDRERIEQLLPGLARAEFDVEFRIVRPDGEIRWVHDRVFPVYNERGEIYRTAGIVEDITERKQVEVALRQSEAQARLAIKVGRLGTWRYNLHTNIVELDKRMREIWGEPDDVGTIPLSRVMERIHPDDRERVAVAIATALDADSSGTYEIEYRIIWDDGTQRWVSANGQVQFEGNGESRQPIGFLGTALDISEQKRAEDEWRRSEQRLQLAQQTGRMGVWEWDLLTNNVFWSDGIWTLLGIEPGSLAPNLESFVKFLHPDEQEQILQRVEIALAQGDNYYDEFQVIREDGTLCWLLSKGQVIRSPDGQPQRLLGINVDITARKQAEVALQESEQRFRRIFECNMIGMGVWTRSGGIIQANDALLNLIGYTRQELNAGLITWQELTPPEQLYLDARLLAQIEVGGVGSPYEKEYIHKTGKRVPILVGGASFSGTADSGIFFAIDLTERKRTEEALRQSEERLRLATEGAQMGTWDVDLNTGKAIWSDQHFTMLGYEPTPTGEASEAIWYSRIHPEDREQVVQEWQQSRQEHRLYRAEYRVVRADTQQIAWLAALGRFVYDLNGKAVRSIGVLFDISDRKLAEVALRESESRFRNIADHSPIMIWMSAPDGAGIWFNQQWCEFTGQTLDEALGSGWLAAVHPEDARLIETSCLQAHQRHEPVSLEYRLRRQDGEYRWVFDSAVARFDETGVYLGYIGSIIDISDRKLAEAEVQRREQEFRAVVENTPDLIIRYDRSLRFLYLNPPIERALGIPPAQFIGRTAVEMGFTDATSQAWNAALQQVFLTAQASTFEFEFPNPEKDRRSYQAYFVPEFVQGGEVKTVLAVVRDVTEYKRTQEALQQSEERYRSALQAARMMTWCWDAKTDKIVRSETACDVIGVSPKALEQGSQGWRLVHPEDLAQHHATVQAAIDAKGSYISEFRIIRPDNGTVIWIEDRGKVNVDAMGHLISIEGTLFDISDRKLAQQERQQTLQTLTTLINASPLPIVVTQPNMTVQLWNPAAEQLFGWSEAEVLDQPIPIVPEEKRDQCYRIQETVAKGEVFAGVETYRCKREGANVIVSVSAAPLYNEQGRLNAILLILQDITQRQQAEEALRQSEERLRLALLVGKAGIWDWDILHNRITWSEQIYQFHGLAPSTFGGRVEDFAQLLYPDDQARVSEAIRQAIEEKAPYELEFRAVQPSGEVRWLSTTGGVIFDALGKPIRMLGATRDITERRAVQEEREQLLFREQQAREEAERANRIKDEFLAILSHELRSPLNPILGWAKLLQSRTLDEQKTKHALATIERNALLQTQLIEDLLDVSRIFRGKLVLNAVPVNLASTIEAALETVRLAADAKEIQIQCLLDPNVETVMGESARLQQVIWNLLSNAVKFTPAGGTIEIRLERINTDAQIQVKDTGIGINPKFLPYVFEYFRQEDGTTTRKFGGLGLGLAIVRHLVELHGGTVWAESPGEGLGATFSVRLPLIPVSTPIPQDNRQTPSVAHLTGLRILVVDDQPDILDIVAFLLEQAGATVRVAACAPDALKLMQQSLPDVLICDIGMPDMDGYMLMRLLRALPAEQGGKIPAIALTAYAGADDQKQALAAGFQRHLTKPVEPEELVRAIASLVQPPRST